MILFRLKLPVHSFQETLENCCLGITGNSGLLERVNTHSHFLHMASTDYSESASQGTLYQISTINTNNDDNPIVFGQLRKSDMLTLYSTYFVSTDKPARKIYSALMTSANEKCPFCGGIGRPRNLDHYLPKAQYPQFSILPINLVPSCRDCNMDGKGTAIATAEAEQFLHPYLDHDRYFNEQWISATYVSGINGQPGVIEYLSEPPEHWTGNQKLRVHKHFNDFDLALRFSKEAGPRLVIYLDQIQKLTQPPLNLEIEVAKSTILQSAIETAPFINHWERVMCLALMSDLV